MNCEFYSIVEYYLTLPIKKQIKKKEAILLDIHAEKRKSSS